MSVYPQAKRYVALYYFSKCPNTTAKQTGLAKLSSYQKRKKQSPLLITSDPRNNGTKFPMFSEMLVPQTTKEFRECVRESKK
jgi:hypothetical protein